MLRKLPFRTFGLAVVVGVALLSIELRTNQDRILALLAVLLLPVIGYFETRRKRAAIEDREEQYRSIKRRVEIERRARRGAP